MGYDMEPSFQVISRTEADTRRIAKAVAGVFRKGDMIILDGDLGAGKTQFVKGFAEGRQSQDLVTSPTFSIANFYRCPAGPDVLHIDLYRLDSEAEVNDLGLDEYFDKCITVIGWGMKFPDCFDDYLLISLQSAENGTRTVSFTPRGARYKGIIGEIEPKLAEE